MQNDDKQNATDNEQLPTDSMERLEQLTGVPTASCGGHPSNDVAAYNRHRRHGETPCPESRLAWSERQKLVRRRLRDEKRAAAND